MAACSSQRGGQANLTWLDPRPDVAPDLARYPRPVERALGLAQLCTSGWEAINHWWDRSVEWPWHRSVQRSTAMCSLPFLDRTNLNTVLAGRILHRHHCLYIDFVLTINSLAVIVCPWLSFPRAKEYCHTIAHRVYNGRQFSYPAQSTDHADTPSDSSKGLLLSQLDSNKW